MQKIRRNIQSTNNTMEEFKVHFRIPRSDEIAQPLNKRGSLPDGLNDHVIKLRRRSWIKSPPNYIKGENGPVKVTVSKGSEKNDCVDEDKEKLNQSIESITDDVCDIIDEADEYESEFENDESKSCCSDRDSYDDSYDNSYDDDFDDDSVPESSNDNQLESTSIFGVQNKSNTRENSVPHTQFYSPSGWTKNGKIILQCHVVPAMVVENDVKVLSARDPLFVPDSIQSVVPHSMEVEVKRETALVRVSIQLLSSWGGSGWVTLRWLTAQDEQGNRVAIDPSSVSFFQGNNAMFSVEESKRKSEQLVGSDLPSENVAQVFRISESDTENSLCISLSLPMNSSVVLHNSSMACEPMAAKNVRVLMRDTESDILVWEGELSAGKKQTVKLKVGLKDCEPSVSSSSSPQRQAISQQHLMNSPTTRAGCSVSPSSSPQRRANSRQHLMNSPTTRAGSSVSPSPSPQRRANSRQHLMNSPTTRAGSSVSPSSSPQRRGSRVQESNFSGSHDLWFQPVHQNREFNIAFAEVADKCGKKVVGVRSRPRLEMREATVRNQDIRLLESCNELENRKSYQNSLSNDDILATEYLKLNIEDASVVSEVLKHREVPLIDIEMNRKSNTVSADGIKKVVKDVDAPLSSLDQILEDVVWEDEVAIPSSFSTLNEDKEKSKEKSKSFRSTYSSKKAEGYEKDTKNNYVSCLTGRSISILLLASYGCTGPIGLSKLKIEGRYEVLDVKPHMVTPIDAHKIMCDTTCEQFSNKLNMWLSKEKIIEICFEEVIEVKALHIWNYNAEFDTDFGARVIKVLIDQKPIGTDGVCFLRKAPGHSLVPFCQTIPLHLSSNSTMSEVNEVKHIFLSKLSIPQDYELQSLPTLLTLRVVIHTSWGDPFYVGLDRIEILDSGGRPLGVSDASLSTVPSLQSLQRMESDSHHPSILLDPTSQEGWLAPLASSLSNEVPLPLSGNNEVYVHFNKPQKVSAIKIYNYSKKPLRGAREVSLFMDGLLVISTTIVMESTLSHQTILFSNDKFLIKKESKYVTYCGSSNQDVLCINDKVMKE